MLKDKIPQVASENAIGAMVSLLITGYMSLPDALSVVMLLVFGGVVASVWYGVREMKRGRFDWRRGFLE